MNTLQQIEFDILKELDNICKTNGIKYYLAYGTALGAVRHKGFIPWDDDIDVVMLRDDYDKFCKLAPEEIPDDLFFQTVYSNIEYPFSFAKLRKKNTAYVEEGQQQLKIQQGIFIDIFPLDYIPNKKNKQVVQRIYAEMLWILMARNRGKTGLKKIFVNLLNLGCTTDKAYLDKIARLEKHIKCPDKERSTKVALMTYGGRAKYAKQYFDISGFGTVYMDFEGQQFPVMSGYDEFLKISYGDYMCIPPKEKRVQHQGYYVNYEKEYQSTDKKGANV